MLVDGLNLLEGSTIKNASIAVGTSFPTSPDAGELFFRSDLSALHVYTGSTWLILDGTATLLQGHPGSYYVDLTNATNTLDVTHGGTSVTSYAALRTALGLDIGVDVQAYDADLSAIAALAGTSGLLRKTAANTWALDSTSYLSTSGGTIVGDLTLTGNIIPSANNTYSLGSATMTWKDVWVGPGSLYVNGKEVLSDVSNTMVFTTDLNQNLRVQTSGTGTLELQADATGTIAVKGTLTITSGKKILDSAGVQVEFGDNIEMGTNKITGLGTPTLGTDAATKSYVDAISVNDSTIVRTSGDQTIGGTKTFSGNVTIGGTLNSAGNTVLFADNIIELNSDFTAGTPTEDAGFQVRRGDLGIAKFYWDETNDRFTMQDGAGANLSLYTTGTITGGSFVGPVSGNASTASTLQTARTIGASGDATAAGQSFNGSANITLPLTLATVNSNVGSFGAADSVSTFTVNGKGLLTAAGSTSIQIAETQITDGSLLARNAGNETITGSWTFNNVVVGADPTLATHLTTKSYVDNAVLGLTWKAPCVAATTANITLSGTQTIDGVAVTAGQRVLVKNQSTGSQNGVYVVSAGAWTRATDFDQTAPIDEVNSAAVFVKGGTTQSDTGWTQTAAVTTVGTDAMTFVQFSAAGAYSAGTGLTLTGNVFSITSPSMTVGSTNIALGGTATTLAGLTSVTSTSFTGNLTGNVTGSVTGGTISGTTITASSDITAGSASKIVSGTGGFQNATYLTASRNRIWSFGNADGFGLSYFQGTSGYTGTDSIGFHFGTATSAASSVNITGSGIVIGTSTVLHSTNFNSYAPTLTGTGASGTWSINVTGNAGTATSATYSRAQGVWDGTGFQPPNHSIGSSGGRGTDLSPNTYNWALTAEFKNSGLYGFAGNYTGLLTFSPWLGTSASTGDPAYQLAFSPIAANNTTSPSLRLRAGIDTTWGAWNTIVHSGNYTSYSPTLTGGNASGTWGINITGNAATATNSTQWGGLALPSPGALPGANGIARSDANGYTFLNYINSNVTNSEVASANISQVITTIGSDNYFRKASIASLAGAVQSNASGTWSINVTGSAGSATTATNLSGGSISATTASFSGQINTKTPVAVTAITSATYNSAPIEIPNLAVAASFPQFVPFVHGSSVITGQGYVQHVTIGNIRTAGASWSGGAFIGLGGNDSYPTEYYTLGFGGTITHSSGTTVLNSSNYTSYALAAGGTAVKASTLAQGGGNGTAMTFNWSGQGGQPTWLWGSNDGSNIYVYNPSNFSVNYATSAGSATTAGSCSGNSATVTHNGSRTDGTAYPVGWFSGANSPAYSCAAVTITSSTGTLSASALYSAGDITAFSDARVKTDVVEIPNALEKVEAIRGVTYTRTDEGFEGVRQAGVIAQEVEAVLPEVVKTNEDGMKSVAYGNLTALLIEAVKELSAQNKALLARIEHLEAHQWN